MASVWLSVDKDDNWCTEHNQRDLLFEIINSSFPPCEVLNNRLLDQTNNQLGVLLERISLFQLFQLVQSLVLGSELVGQDRPTLGQEEHLD